MKKKIIIIIIAVLMAFSIALFALYREQKVTVLGYHDFTTKKPTSGMQINMKDFKRQMDYLKRHHYNTITLKQMECFINKTCTIPRKSVLITIDDGYKSNYDLAFPMLEEYGFNAVVFYIGVNSDASNGIYMDKDIINESKIKYPNIEFASHTYDLHHENDYLLDYDTINNDFNRMKSVLDTKYFAYPYGHVSKGIEDALENSNYKLAFTFGPNREHRKAKSSDDKYHIPRLFISGDMPYFKYILRLIIPF